MLRWCSYCQEFQGEAPPFDNLGFTHGICPSCQSTAFLGLDGRIDRAEMLRDIQDQLMIVAQAHDMDRATGIVDFAISSGVRPVDILWGLLSPLLFTIGVWWNDGIISVADEHRFTASCEKIFDLVEERARAMEMPAASRRPVALVMNAYGNTHVLAIRILALWLRSISVDAVVQRPPLRAEEFLETLQRIKPQIVLVSLALAEQRPGVVKMMEPIQSMPFETRPKVFVGGYAVKMRAVSAIPGAVLLKDITELAGQMEFH